MARNNLEDNSDKINDELNKAIERALVKIGMVAEGHAKLLCPVDTGRLRGSIVYITSTTHGKGEPPAEPKDYTPMGVPEKGSVYIGTNVEYASDVEFGTHKQKAQPYLRPAAENHTEEYNRIVEAELKGR